MSPLRCRPSDVAARCVLDEQVQHLSTGRAKRRRRASSSQQQISFMDQSLLAGSHLPRPRSRSTTSPNGDAPTTSATPATLTVDYRLDRVPPSSPTSPTRQVITVARRPSQSRKSPDDVPMTTKPTDIMSPPAINVSTASSPSPQLTSTPPIAIQVIEATTLTAAPPPRTSRPRGASVRSNGTTNVELGRRLRASSNTSATPRPSTSTSRASPTRSRAATTATSRTVLGGGPSSPSLPPHSVREQCSRAPRGHGHQLRVHGYEIAGGIWARLFGRPSASTSAQTLLAEDEVARGNREQTVLDMAGDGAYGATSPSAGSAYGATSPMSAVPAVARPQQQQLQQQQLLPIREQDAASMRSAKNTELRNTTELRSRSPSTATATKTGAVVATPHRPGTAATSSARTTKQSTAAAITTTNSPSYSANNNNAPSSDDNLPMCLVPNVCNICCLVSPLLCCWLWANEVCVCERCGRWTREPVDNCCAYVV